MNFNDIVQTVTVFAIPLIFGITLHEASHAYAARYFGDSTAYMLGRMTLNPLKHIDPFWTIAFPLIVLVATNFQFAFGAAKPVPLNFNALRNPKRDSIWVAAAGPFANLVMMVGWALLHKLLGKMGGGQAVEFIYLVAGAGMLVNAWLMVLNLIPVLPLDGGRILAGLLPNRLSYSFSRLEPYGMFIVALLMVVEMNRPWLSPLVGSTLKALYFVLGS
jgi:Zn-dependent protease